MQLVKIWHFWTQQEWNDINDKSFMCPSHNKSEFQFDKISKQTSIKPIYALVWIWPCFFSFVLSLNPSIMMKWKLYYTFLNFALLPNQKIVCYPPYSCKPISFSFPNLALNYPWMTDYRINLQTNSQLIIKTYHIDQPTSGKLMAPDALTWVKVTWISTVHCFCFSS